MISSFFSTFHQHRIIHADLLRRVLDVLEWVFTHGSCLGVIEGGVWIQVVEVFGSIFSDTQISHGSTSLRIKLLSCHICLVSIFLLVSTVITVIDSFL